MRYLSFELGTDDKKYHMIYDALVTRQNGYNTSEGRTIGKVFDKLEAIGAQEVTGTDKLTLYKLAKSGVVALEDAEYGLVTEVFKSTRWPGNFIRDAIAIEDMLTNAPSEPPLKEVTSA